ncbi:hypothetical protein HDU98_005335 [Podochytrium sp. JEL0797]|nr:hypothetical protein HDU98_005335 [Podochytrium sp. JEL0797]
MSYVWSQILIAGNCYNSDLTIATPVVDYGYSCASHFYCPNATPSVVQSLPQICAPTDDCILARLATNMCQPNGPYEPEVCPTGNYCPDVATLIQCPEGYWCPTGSIAPRPCPTFSICPAGSLVPKYYGGLIFCVIADTILLFLYLFVRFCVPALNPLHRAASQKLKASWNHFRIKRNDSKKVSSSEDISFGVSLGSFTNLVNRSGAGGAEHSAIPSQKQEGTLRKRINSHLPNAVLGLSNAQVLADKLGVATRDPAFRVEECSAVSIIVDTPMLDVPAGQNAINVPSIGSVEYTAGASKPTQIIVAGNEFSVENHIRAENMGGITQLGKLPSAANMANFVHAYRRALEGRDDIFIDFRFKDLGLSLPNGKTILKGVNGTIRSKKLTAIMGPSGCGKTTFMNVLMGKVARTSGKLFINEEEGEMQKYKKIIGFVPQEDIMLRELSVRENIFHSARVRLPQSWSRADVDKYVDAVLEVLNLSHIQHNIIGTESERGISGGQSKRVNILIELAGVPLAIFLDEPTSGLDSTAALKVSEILRRVAFLGLTAVAVIHQPRYEIFQQFNDILMLVSGGKTAYMGPTKRVVAYFQDLGFYFDSQANPADILMDILNGKGINTKGANLNAEGLVQKWNTVGKEWVEIQNAKSQSRNASLLGSNLTLGAGGGGGGGGFAQAYGGSMQSIKHSEEEQKSSHKELELISKKRGSNVLVQIFLCHNRFLIQQYRRPWSLVLEICVSLIAGGLVRILCFSIPSLSQKKLDWRVNFCRKGIAVQRNYC